MKGIRKSYAIIAPGFLPVPAFQGGAVEVLTELIADGLNQKDIDFDLYTISDERYSFATYKHGSIVQIKSNNIDFYVSKMGNVILRLKRSQWRLRPYHIALLRAIKNKQYENVLVENNMELFWVIHTFTKNKTNLIYHLHNDIDDYSKSPQKCLFVINKAKRILVVSEYLRNRVLDVQNNSITEVLLNCINLAKFKKITIKNTDIRYNLGIEKNDIVIMYTGRVDTNKGVLELVKAFNAVCKTISNIKLVIVGASWFDGKADDPYENQVRFLCENNNNIVTTGFIHPKDIPNILNCADIVAIPSKWEEPFGVVAIEAMYMKKAIISSNSGGLKYILDSSSAVLVDRDNLIEEIYSAIIDLVADPDKRARIAQNAYDRFMSTPAYDSKNYIDEYLQLVEDK